MFEVALVSCTRTKADHVAPAAHLYTSKFFVKAKQYACSYADMWFVVSAKHGLVSPEEVLEPYDFPFSALSPKEQKQWAKSVWSSLERRLGGKGAEVTMLLDDAYADALMSISSPKQWVIQRPLRGRSADGCRSWLADVLGETTRREDIGRFYSQIERLRDALGGIPRLRQLPLEYKVPERGVYYFFEDGETRTAERSGALRVVRVGTHAVSAGSKATLWNRLKAHKGATGGGGNHRTSIFRLHIGAAIRAATLPPGAFPTWGLGQSTTPDLSAGEAELEYQVTDYLNSMHLLWLSIPDLASPSSDRAYIEQNSIALLAGQSGPFDYPSEDWLGWKSPNESIRASGLWNVNYVRNKCDHRFLDVLTHYVDLTLGLTGPPSCSIAPRGWHHSHKHLNQMGLFGGEASNERGQT